MFEIGDVVKCINTEEIEGELRMGGIYTVVDKDILNYAQSLISVKNKKGDIFGWYVVQRFKLVKKA